ncbi:MAG: MBL fold metallo-hydrolase [Prevotella sp.]|nr:MBL fold metallo-hydrolase [Prevotella sp.]
MKLTHIFHSGFVLETEKSILIFDYWLDPGNVVPPFLQKDKQVYVFSSHFHEDHFNSAVFEWKKQREGITYILSKDIYKHRRANKGICLSHNRTSGLRMSPSTGMHS